MENIHVFKSVKNQDFHCQHCVWVNNYIPEGYKGVVQKGSFYSRDFNEIENRVEKKDRFSDSEKKNNGIVVFASHEKLRYSYAVVSKNHVTRDDNFISYVENFIKHLYKTYDIQNVSLLINSHKVRMFEEKEHLHAIVTVRTKYDERIYDKLHGTIEGASGEGEIRNMAREPNIDDKVKVVKPHQRNDMFSSFKNTYVFYSYHKGVFECGKIAYGDLT